MKAAHYGSPARDIGCLVFVVILLIFAPGLATADEKDDRIRALESRIEALEKRLGGESSVEKPKPGPSVSIGASGFTLRSADTNFVLRLRGLLHADSRWYFSDGGIADNDSFVLRRARPILEGTVFRDFTFLFSPEFGGSSAAIRDAWLNYRYDEGLQLRAGKMKSPGSLERWQSVSAIPFIERSLVSGFWPVRDLGVMLHGELWSADEEVTRALGWSGVVNYALGAFNGAADGRAAGNSDIDDDKTVAGRLFFHPFLKTSAKPLRTLGVGLSGTYGHVEGANALPDDRGYATEGQQGFFEYLSGTGADAATANITADGPHWRLGPQGYWYWQSFGLLGEYAVSSQRLRRQAGPVNFMRAGNSAWTVAASWLLTGEEASFRSLTPKKSFDPRAGGWGAWQAVARYSELDIDDELFPDFADPTVSATRAVAWGIGLTWYLNRNVRASVNFNHTDFKGGQQGSVAGRDENALLTRVQLAF